MSVTLKEIAQRAQVSEATVSLALSGSQKVHPDTSRRISAFAEEMGYRPRKVARGQGGTARQARLRTRNILMLYVEGQFGVSPRNMFFSKRIEAFQCYLSPRQCVLMMRNVPMQCTYEMADDIFSQTRVDGVLVIAPLPRPVLDFLWERKIPVVHDYTLPAQDTARWTSIASNNYGGTISAVKHLVSLGHTRIGFFSGTQSQPALERRRGYQVALLESNLPVRKEYIVVVDDPAMELERRGYEGMKHLLALPEPPTAVFAAGDLDAVSAMQCCRDHGLEVPGDISMVGFNDEAIARTAHPPLTTVLFDQELNGTVAAQELFLAMTEPSYAPKKAVIPARLIVRESTAPPREKFV